MKILTETDIDGAAARWLRQQAGLSQAAFWASLGAKQPTGANYETGGNLIPQPVRILMFVKYVAKLNLDVTTEAGAEALVKLAVLQEADSHMERAERALRHLAKARAA